MVVKYKMRWPALLFEYYCKWETISINLSLIIKKMRNEQTNVGSLLFFSLSDCKPKHILTPPFDCFWLTKQIPVNNYLISLFFCRIIRHLFETITRWNWTGPRWGNRKGGSEVKNIFSLAWVMSERLIYISPDIFYIHNLPHSSGSYGQ